MPDAIQNCKSELSRFVSKFEGRWSDFFVHETVAIRSILLVIELIFFKTCLMQFAPNNELNLLK